ncbi:MAG: hypothetical protein MJ130_11240 [Lachnospiraceae bacterium]|nr:hypothetical protein [Lachnospiraceae bacterium]
MQKSGKKIGAIIVIIVLFAMWFTMGAIDYFRVSSFESPLFCIGKESVYKGAEDYKHYQGLGYSFEVAESPFESEYPGIIRYTYFLFGNEMVSGIRE